MHPLTTPDARQALGGVSVNELLQEVIPAYRRGEYCVSLERLCKQPTESQSNLQSCLHAQQTTGLLPPLSGNIRHYIILNNGILRSNTSVFPQSEGYISQYTP